MNILDLIPSVDGQRHVLRVQFFVAVVAHDGCGLRRRPLPLAKRHVVIETKRDLEPERRCACGRRLPCHRRICRRP